MDHRHLPLGIGIVVLLGMVTGCAEVGGVNAVTAHPMVDFAVGQDVAPQLGDLHASHFGFEFTPRAELLPMRRSGTAIPASGAAPNSSRGCGL